MKIKSLFWGSLALLGLAVSCQEPVNSEPAVILTSDAVVNVGAEGADAVDVTFTSATAWELRGLDDCDWLVADKLNGKGSADEQKLTLSISPNPEGNREVSLTIYASPLAKKTVTVQQAGEKGDGVADITIAEFLELKNTTQSYRLGGVIGDIARSTSYYGFTQERFPAHSLQTGIPIRQLSIPETGLSWRAPIPTMHPRIRIRSRTPTSSAIPLQTRLL